MFMDVVPGGTREGVLSGMRASILPAFAYWLYDLHDVARRGGSPTQILAVAGQQIPYQFVLFDGSYALVAYEPNGRPVPPSMQDVLIHGFAMHVSAEHQDAYREGAREHPSGFSLEYEGDGEPVPLWVKPIKTIRGEPYYLHIMGMRGEDSLSRALVDELATELSAALVFKGGTNGNVHGDLVQALVTKRLTEREVDERIRFFGWRRTVSYRVVRVLSRGGFVPETQWGHHARRIAELLPGVYPSVMDEGLTLLVFNDAEKGMTSSDVSALEGLLEGSLLIAGVSDYSRDWDNIPRYYRQACDAAGVMRDWRARGQRPDVEGCEGPCPERRRCMDSLGCFRPRRVCVCSFEECRLPLLLRLIDEEDAEGDLVPQALRLLESYDLAHGSFYTATLLCYLRNLANKMATCRDLSIHRTTLDYRLGRIATIGSIDFGDRLQLRELVLWSFLWDVRHVSAPAAPVQPRVLRPS